MIRRFRYSTGFTLVEMLVVLVIIGVLAALLAPAFNSMNRATGITSGGTSLSSAIKLANIQASSMNRNIAVVFYRPDGAGTGPDDHFTSYQTWKQNSEVEASTRQDSSGNPLWWQPLSRREMLTEGVVIDGDEATFSKLLDQLPADIPESGNHFGFIIRPDGSLPVPKEDSFLVMHAGRGEEGEIPGIPANFAIITVNPANAEVSIHRP